MQVLFWFSEIKKNQNEQIEKNANIIRTDIFSSKTCKEEKFVSPLL